MVIPAIDIREGRCVRLYQGELGTETTYYEKPVDALKHWLSLGAKLIHVVDLDAATGIGNNRSIIKNIVISAGKKADIQVGGGIRTAEVARDLLGIGVKRIALGTAAVKDPALVSQLASEHGSEAIIVALDHKGGKVQIKGWTEDSGKDVLELGSIMAENGAGYILLSAVEADGTFAGPDFDTTARLIERTSIPVLAAGGTRNLEDIARLREIGAAGVVIGKALYEGQIDLVTALQFNE